MANTVTTKLDQGVLKEMRVLKAELGFSSYSELIKYLMDIHGENK